MFRRIPAELLRSLKGAIPDFVIVNTHERSERENSFDLEIFTRFSHPKYLKVDEKFIINSMNSLFCLGTNFVIPSSMNNLPTSFIYI